MPDKDADVIRDWFVTWAGQVAAVDFVSARKLFHPDVIGFGTFMDVVRGLDHLETRQWRSIWPTIEGFRFLVDQLVSEVSEDGKHAYGIVPWISTGFHESGEPYDRPGRATVLFTRPGTAAPWLAIHTHISLAPGTPQKSHGSRPEKKP
ncbi:nuclear transport factor 2 family protein [soil metagenome]|jgi:ketosteroid isomerase-like protein